MSDRPPVTAKFDYLFKKALTDAEGQRPKSMKEKERDHYALTTNFLSKLTKTEDIDTCIDRYFALYRSYSPDDPRSKMIFAILLTKRITQTDDLAWLADLNRTLDEKERSSCRIRSRFDELGDNEKRQVRGDLLRALRQHETILDELKQAWKSTHKEKKITTEDLYAFNPFPDPKLQTAHQAIMDTCRKAWDDCTKTFDENTWTQFGTAFGEYLNFLKDLTKDSLKLFQILKWCRDPLLGKKVLVGKGRQQHVELYRAPADDLNEQFYLQTAFAVFLRAAAVKQLKRNARGFTRDEEPFFLDPLSRTFYFSNYTNHYLFGARKDASKFSDICLWHLWLIQFGKFHNVWLVNDKTFGEIATLFDAVVEIAKKGTGDKKGTGKEKGFSTKGKATWAYAKDYFKIHQKIGVGANEFEIIYFENEDTGYPDIYIEYKQMKGSIFRMDINTYIKRVESAPYQIIMKNTATLNLLILEFWGFIFTMFFPGIGYFQLFFQRGFLGVLEQFLVQQQIDLIMETMSQVKGAGGGGGFDPALLNWLGVLTNRKGAAKQILASSKRSILGQGEKEARGLLSAGESDVSRFGESELGSRGLATQIGEAGTKRKSLRVIGEPSKEEIRLTEKAEQERLLAEAERKASQGVPTPPVEIRGPFAEQARANFQKNMERLGTPQVRKRKGGGWATVEEYDKDLVEAVKQERAANTDVSPASFGSNVAAMRVRIKGHPEEIITASNIPKGSPLRPGLHSEHLLEEQLQDMVAKLDALKGKETAARRQRIRFREDVEVTAIYSEREPCSTSFCNKLMADEFPNAKVYFTLPEHDVHPTARGMLDPRIKELRDAWLGPLPKKPPKPKPKK
jgi:hypothetical protein